jgi:hypothetical protein
MLGTTLLYFVILGHNLTNQRARTSQRKRGGRKERRDELHDAL